MKDEYNSEYKEVFETIKHSDTQEIRVGIVETETGDKIGIQKFWRKDVNENWNIGKGFQFDTVEDAEKLNEGIMCAIAYLKLNK